MTALSSARPTIPGALGRLAVAGVLTSACLLVASSARADIDQVSLPGPSGDVNVSAGAWMQTFTAMHTAPLEGLWIAADATNCPPSAPFAVCLVPVIWGGAHYPAYADVLNTEECASVPSSTWQGGGEGNLQLLPLVGSPMVTAGASYGIWVRGCGVNPVVAATSNGYPGELSSTYNGRTILPPDASTAGKNMVFLTQIGAATADFVNDSDPAIQYIGGGWADYPGRPVNFGDVDDDVHATLNDDDAVVYPFTGTGITYLSEISDGYGLVAVYVDGVYKATVNANAPGVANLGGAHLFSVSGLSPGRHEIALVKGSGVYMLLDGFIVQH